MDKSRQLIMASESCGKTVGRVLHGTCGWSDPSLVSCGRFYPKSVKTSEEKLRIFSRTFGCVEVRIPFCRV